MIFKIILSLTLILNFCLGPVIASQTLSTTIVENRVKDLTTQIHWFKSLKDAEAEAKAQNKMIFWVQMLGEMDGGT